MPDIPVPDTPNDPEVTHAQWQECVIFAKDYYDILADFVPGDTTVNELRILTELAVASSSGTGTSVSEIADRTEISRATVSRLVTQWMAAGRITESPHPKDGRRRILDFSGEAKQFSGYWSQRVIPLLHAER